MKRRRINELARCSGTGVGEGETLGDARSCGGNEIADGLRPDKRAASMDALCFANASVTMRCVACCHRRKAYPHDARLRLERRHHRRARPSPTPIMMTEMISTRMPSHR